MEVGADSYSHQQQQVGGQGEQVEEKKEDTQAQVGLLGAKKPQEQERRGC